MSLGKEGGGEGDRYDNQICRICGGPMMATVVVDTGGDSGNTQCWAIYTIYRVEGGQEGQDDTGEVEVDLEVLGHRVQVCRNRFYHESVQS